MRIMALHLYVSNASKQVEVTKCPMYLAIAFLFLITFLIARFMKRM